MPGTPFGLREALASALYYPKHSGKMIHLPDGMLRRETRRSMGRRRVRMMGIRTIRNRPVAHARRKQEGTGTT